MVVSYKLSIVTVALSVTIRQQFAIECLRRSNHLGRVTLGQNLGRNGLIDVSQILKRYRRDRELPSVQKNSCRCLLPLIEHNATMHERDRQTTEQ